jgi:hypothetical protein
MCLLNSLKASCEVNTDERREENKRGSQWTNKTKDSHVRPVVLWQTLSIILHSNRNVSETGLRFCFQMAKTQLGPVHRASLFLPDQRQWLVLSIARNWATATWKRRQIAVSETLWWIMSRFVFGIKELVLPTQYSSISNNNMKHEWGRRGTLIDYWWQSQREGDH